VKAALQLRCSWRVATVQLHCSYMNAASAQLQCSYIHAAAVQRPRSYAAAIWQCASYNHNQKAARRCIRSWLPRMDHKMLTLCAELAERVVQGQTYTGHWEKEDKRRNKHWRPKRLKRDGQLAKYQPGNESTMPTRMMAQVWLQKRESQEFKEW
jgi:hypothetical protein